ncbi:MAG TPA: D-2-hydroxyacid dehydrogenase [Burkholderiales bacterium]|nr:D-2-hydroxyacid dehydrogenase [Burkholderiales bacterium]
MTHVLLLLALPEEVRKQYLRALAAAFPEVKFDLVEHHSKAEPCIAAAEVLVTFGPMMSDRVLERAARLRWIQALGTGMDGIIDRPALGNDVLLTNVHGIHGAPVSEAAIMALLALSRGLPRSQRNQSRHKWDRFPARLLKDKTVGIFGVGAIAQELAPKCKAFGMTVIGITSAPREVAGFDRMVAREALERIAGELDYLVLLTPYSPATHGIVGARVFAAMKPGGYLVNLARGGVVDEAALVDALKSGRLAGAALDVFAQEPLPPEHPFWDMEQVLVTAHQGGFCDVYVDHALPVIEHNLRCFLSGDLERMINVVRR